MPLARADVNIRALAPAILGSRTAGMDASMTHASSVISASSRRRVSRPGTATVCAGPIRFARRASAFAALVILAACVSGCNKLKARDLLNKGVAAFKNAQYDAAIEDFKQAKDLDP